MRDLEASGPILVLDPDADSRRRLRALLARLGPRVEDAATAAELRAALDVPPALVVLEVDLPDASGYELCRELQDRFGDDLPVIFVSGTRTDPGDRVAGLLLGADDYLVKPFDPDELLARVRRSLRRVERYRERTAETGQRTRGLTPREREVLTLLAEGLNQQQIAARLVISSKTVGTHIQRILGKLDVNSRAQAVAIAHRNGLVDDVAGHGLDLDAAEHVHAA